VPRNTVTKMPSPRARTQPGRKSCISAVTVATVDDHPKPQMTSSRIATATLLVKARQPKATPNSPAARASTVLEERCRLIAPSPRGSDDRTDAEGGEQDAVARGTGLQLTAGDEGEESPDGAGGQDERDEPQQQSESGGVWRT
jgi:hypothetical protein